MPFQSLFKKSKNPAFSKQAIKKNNINTMVNSLVDIVIAGQGGSKTLNDKRLADTSVKLQEFYGLLVEDGNLTEKGQISNNSKGFKTPPENLVNQGGLKSNFYIFLTAYMKGCEDGQIYCGQNLNSDIYEWTKQVINKQHKHFTPTAAKSLIDKMSKAADLRISEAEFKKNPGARNAETLDEAIDFVYFMAGRCDNETAWKDFGVELYNDKWPDLNKITYTKAQQVYKKRNDAGDYRLVPEDN
ncbi:hypothetical protein [Rouxiella sp. WC2420]|uniref:Uncharacterized protein n=1 Tax=Rouxiella sp. WC2420 TaxID=3234145 RepID=A0AB39VQ22_9GAMM